LHRELQRCDGPKSKLIRHARKKPIELSGVQKTSAKTPDDWSKTEELLNSVRGKWGKEKPEA